jgi:hypothetical protein
MLKHFLTGIKLSNVLKDILPFWLSVVSLWLCVVSNLNGVPAISILVSRVILTMIRNVNLHLVRLFLCVGVYVDVPYLML